MTLEEFVKAELVQNNKILSNKVFKRGLVLYEERYKDNKAETELWKAKATDSDWVAQNPLPTPLLIGIPAKTIADKRALSAALVAGLHDQFLPSNVPVVPKKWSKELKNFLENSCNAYQKNRRFDVSSGVGLYLKTELSSSIESLKETDIDDELPLDAEIVLSMSDRLILIKGLNSFFVSGPGQWDFLMDVASSTKSGESCRANKTNVDGLRNALKKQYGDGLGKAILKRLITFDRGCGYRLGDTVKRSNSSQIAIKRTIRKADPFEPYEGD